MTILFFCFLLPALSAFRLTLVGEVSYAEPVMLLYLVFNLRKVRAIFSTPTARTVINLGLFWLINLVASDLYRGSLYEDFSRGWAKIVVLILSYATCFTLVGSDSRRLVAFSLGIYFSPILEYIQNGTNLPLYKFIFGMEVSLATFIVTAFLSKEPRIWLSLIPLSAGALAFSLNARSLAGITIVSAVYYAFLSTGWLNERTGQLRRVFSGAVLIAVAYSPIFIYSNLATNQRLTNDALDKFEEQVNQSGGKFTIFSGRSELSFSLPKIIESPLIGFGSWAKDVDYVAQRATELGFDPALLVSSTKGVIPAHSHFFGSWLEAGLMGGVFWGYILFNIGFILLSGGLSKSGRWSGVSCFLIILFAWDILFSPFGGERRINSGFFAWVVTFFVIEIHHQRQRHRRDQGLPFKAQCPHPMRSTYILR